MRKRQQRAKDKVAEARAELTATLKDPAATHEKRMAAKDTYNRSLRDLAGESGTRAPYG